jgi:hypothetical protein
MIKVCYNRSVLDLKAGSPSFLPEKVVVFLLLWPIRNLGLLWIAESSVNFVETGIRGSGPVLA